MDNLFFLNGLPRSGNTLFSCILNQNPDLCVTAKSPVVYILENFYNQLEEEQEVHLANFPDYKSFDNAITGAVEGYYKNWTAPYIIDRAHWGTPNNIELIKKYITPSPKFICLYRPLEEVVASFIKWGTENDNIIFDSDMNQDELFERAIEENNIISECLYAFINLVSTVHPESLLFITYDDLVNKTEQVIERTYAFLGLPKYEHNLNQLDQFELNGITYDDEQYAGKNLHKIRTDAIRKDVYNLSNYLSPEQLEQMQGTSSLIEALVNARGLS